MRQQQQHTHTPPTHQQLRRVTNHTNESPPLSPSPVHHHSHKSSSSPNNTNTQNNSTSQSNSNKNINHLSHSNNSVERENEISYSYMEVHHGIDAVIAKVIFSHYAGNTDHSGRSEGSGTARFINHNVYSGEFRNGMMDGRGVFMWSDGTRYEGDFVRNQIIGNGTYVWEDGSSYSGAVGSSLRDGKGSFLRTSSSHPAQYKGEWKQAKREGLGQMTVRESKKIQAAGPENTNNGGNGTTKNEDSTGGAANNEDNLANGVVSSAYYDGSWKANVRVGKGVARYKSGNEYRGEWVNGKKDGYGMMLWRDRHEVYRGEWKAGSQNGKGEYYWFLDYWTEDANGNVIEIHSGEFMGNYYSGEWENGLRHGQGTFYYADGSKYEGGWFQNLKQGRGTYTYADGLVYTGEFLQDKMVDEYIRETDSQIFDIHLALLDDIFPASQHSALLNILLRYVSITKRIYTYYASLGRSHANSLTTLHCSQFLKDCKVFNRDFNRVSANRILSEQFRRANGATHPLAQNPHTTTHPLLYREFLEFLIRVALHVTSFQAYLPSPPTTPVNTVDVFFRERVVSNVGEDGPKNGNNGTGLKIVQLHTSYYAPLLRIYESHAKPTKHSLPLAEKDVTLTIRNAIVLLKERKLIDDKGVGKIVKLFEDEEGRFDVETELCFYDFICIISSCIADSSDEEAVAFINSLQNKLF